MNFLVHSWLGREDPAYIAGAFLGDFIKGTLPNNLDPGLTRGLQLHRYIDGVSNRMDEMRSTYVRFGPPLRRVAPILLDLVADHLLARYWDRHGEGVLTDFSSHCYEAIAQFEIPSTAISMYEHMVETNLWSNYDDLQVIYGIMRRILKRLKMTEREAHLEDIGSNLDALYSDFCIYFPLLEREAQDWLLEQHNLVDVASNQ